MLCMAVSCWPDSVIEALSEHETSGQARWFRNDNDASGVFGREHDGAGARGAAPFRSRIRRPGMPLASAPVRPWRDHLHEFAEWLGAHAQPLRRRDNSADRHLVATATLLAVAASAVVAFT